MEYRSSTSELDVPDDVRVDDSFAELRRRATALRREARLLRAAARESRERSLLVRAYSELLQEKLMGAAAQRRAADE